MRENQRGTRTYADNASTGIQGRIKIESNAENSLLQKQDEVNSQPAELSRACSEGMIYLDIIPRFAL